MNPTKPNILCFGCIGHPGHCLRDKTNGVECLDSTPWGRDIDTGILKAAGCSDRIPSPVVMDKKDGWTAIAFWDRSGDARPGSNTVFLAEGDFSTKELMKLAREQWPEVFNRKGFQVKAFDLIMDPQHS